MNCFNHWLYFPSLSISSHVLLTIDLLISHTVLLETYLFPLESFSLSVILRPLNTFMVRSAIWNMIIPLIRVKSNYADLFYLTIAALQVFRSFPILEESEILKIPTVTDIYVTTTLICKHYCKGCIQMEIVAKFCEKMHQRFIYFFACTPFKNSESIKIEQKHIHASESLTKFAFAISLHVVCQFSFWEKKVNYLHIKNEKKN